MTVQWSARPQLRRPALVAAFEGWNDAADAASDAVRWLGRALDAEPFAEIEADEFFDFQAARPRVTIVDGVVRRLAWPRTRFLAATPPGGDRDLVLLLGVEPNLRWPAFCREVLDVARECGCEILVTLGALLADVPHTRPPRVTGVTDDAAAIRRLHLRQSRYEGPTGIVGVLHAESRGASISSASLWATVPHYVATPPNPKATHALLDRLSALLEITLDLSELESASGAWEEQVDEVAADDKEVSGYVRSLEDRYDEEAEAPFELGADDTYEENDDDDDLDGGLEIIDDETLPSGDALAADFERYLREQGDTT